MILLNQKLKIEKKARPYENVNKTAKERQQFFKVFNFKFYKKKAIEGMLRKIYRQIKSFKNTWYMH